MTFEMEMVDEIKMEVPSDELAHHGTKGMRWGVRRYQNKDGSLTVAGRRKRASEQGDAKVKRIESRTDAKIQKMKEDYVKNKKIARAQAKADAKLAKAEAKYSLDKKKKSEDTETTKPKPKSLSEMSNDELRDKIERVRLEQQLAALTPQEKSKGKAFVEAALNDVVVPAAKNAGRAYLEKTMKKALGLDEKDPMEKLKKEAEKLGYMKTIEQAKKDIDKIKNPKNDEVDYDAETKKLNLQKLQAQTREADAKAGQAETKDAQDKWNFDQKQKGAQKAEEKEAQAKAAKEEAKAKKDAEESERSQKQTEKESERAQKQAQKQTDKAEKESEKVYTGTVEGEGKSRFNGWDDGPIIDAEFREYADTPMNSTTSTALAVSGRQYLKELWDD